MYKVMIIDDEAIIRERLKSIIDWEGLSLTLVCEAGDSNTARELFFLHRPSIVITDINIPVISGLELCQEFTQTYPDTRFIVITGYNDFEYVRASVSLGAVDLISKPILREEINQSLEKAIKYFRSLVQTQEKLHALRRALRENRSLLLDRCVSRLFYTKNLEQDSIILDELAALGLKIRGNHYFILILSPDWDTFPPDFNRDLVLSSLQNIGDEFLDKGSYRHYAFFDSHFRINYLISRASPSNDHLEQLANNIRDRVWLYYHASIHGGISLSSPQLSGVHELWTQAWNSCDYSYQIEDSPILNYKNKKQLPDPLENPCPPFTQDFTRSSASSPPTSQNRLIASAKLYMQEHLSDPGLGLTSVSEHIGLSSIYFCNLFHREEGISFNEYLNQERIKKARQLLADPSMKIYEVSYAVGYGNPKYFNFIFKKLVKLTPSEYRRSL